MKSLKIFLLLIINAFLLVSCGKDEVTNLETMNDYKIHDSNVESIVPVKSDIKVLFIGNSFTEDACSYIPFLFADVAHDVNFVFGIAYIPGSPLIQHYVNATGTEIVLDDYQYVPSLYTLNIARNNELSWNRIYNLTLNDILDFEKWDIVTFQPSGAQSILDYDKYYSPYLTELKKCVKERVQNDVKVGWLSIHGCYHVTDEGLYENWDKTTNNSKMVMEYAGYDVIFPFGTAVQNLRNCNLIENEADNLGWSVDGGHLQEGLGCLCAAYANTLVLLNEINYSSNPSFIFTPTPSNIIELNIPGLHLGEKGLVGITDSNREIALESAKAAIINPYKTTNIEDMLGVDIIMDDK